MTKVIPATESPTGRKLIKIGVKSLNSDKYPPNQGAVRADTKISGYYIDEIKPNVCKIDFMIESDFKISLFIAKQVAPKSSNYAFFLKDYMKKNQLT